MEQCQHICWHAKAHEFRRMLLTLRLLVQAHNENRGLLYMEHLEKQMYWWHMIQYQQHLCCVERQRWQSQQMTRECADGNSITDSKYNEVICHLK